VARRAKRPRSACADAVPIAIQVVIAHADSAGDLDEGLLSERTI